MSRHGKNGGPRYLMWYDDNPKVPLGEKIDEAVEAYTRRFAISPNIVLVNENDLTESAAVLVRSAEFVRRNNFWVGFDRTLERAPTASLECEAVAS
jgi:hypothetical protein